MDMYIFRTIEPEIVSHLLNRSCIILLGPRQAGKSTLVDHLISNDSFLTKLQIETSQIEKYNGDNFREVALLSSLDIIEYKRNFASTKLLIIDEAQKIPNIGEAIKILFDQLKIIVLATGSSSFELSNKTKESLAGRAVELYLTPFSYAEIKQQNPDLTSSLIFGQYPKIFNTSGNNIKTKLINDLTNISVIKDIIDLKNITTINLLPNLLKYISYQVGSRISLREIGEQLEADSRTIGNYIKYLEDAFVVFRLLPLTNNPRNAIKTYGKVFFYDNGVVNALTRSYDLNPINSGGLLENYVISEVKKITVNDPSIQLNYFNSKSSKEVDLIITKGPKRYAYEIKFSKKAKVSIPKELYEKYTGIEVDVINSENIFEKLVDISKI